MRRPIAVALAVVALVAGCSSKHDPDTVIELTDPSTAGDLSVATKQVSLSVGQVVAVQVKRQALPASWRQTDAGDGATVRADGEDTVKSCPADQPGCPTTVRERYKAVKAGTTTIEWRFVGMGPATAPAGVPTVACPQIAADATCPVGVMKIVVTVHG